MDAMAVIGIVVSTLALFTGFMLLFIERKFARQDKRAEARRRENILSMQWMVCAGTAIQEMANAIKTQKCNGDLTTAVAKVAQCGEKLDSYFIEQNAQINH